MGSDPTAKDAKCANCGKTGHPASYRGCEKYIPPKRQTRNINMGPKPNTNKNKNEENINRTVPEKAKPASSMQEKKETTEANRQPQLSIRQKKTIKKNANEQEQQKNETTKVAESTINMNATLKQLLYDNMKQLLEELQANLLQNILK
ncbi:hypothetical protein WA026_005194 [Henosepilachna vigintioctopunctata]|uniref:Uncharacterized protein n=1 Tax=Henosepilachna vigintioctopunctata TaxID=420089 RepID=A0AAW1UNA8_9CUCU